MAIDPGLRRLALNTLLAAFPGHAAPDWAGELLAEGLAGHTLFGANVGEPEQVARLTAQLRSARPDALIAIDEEGGDVTRLGHRTGSPYPGNAALGAADDPELTRRIYAAIGADLAAVGINLNLAPTVDVNSVAENPIIGTRSFGAGPALVARHTGAAVAGLQANGVAACAKHFPGHGATVTDSHLELPTVDVPLAVLRERDLPPFAAAVEAGTRAVMSAHIRVPELTGDGPATFSRAALAGLLRGELGFRGAIVTDALEMRGAAATAGSIPRAAVTALAAGADLLCIGAVVDRALVEAIAAEIAAATGDGRLGLARLEDAVARTAELAAWSATPRPAGPADGDLGVEAARRGMIVEGDPAELRSPLVVQFVAGHSIAEGRVPWGLGPHLDGIEQIEVPADGTTPEALAAAAGDRPIVLVGRRLHSSPAARTLIGKLAAERPVGVVEMGWPSPWRPERVRVYVVTHGASLANGRAAAEALHLHHAA
ncbi:glycoside hydrolase family 3 protein [Actinoplanes hulinensis]|uniref:Glycoside hydrolase family 3 protein n=1 Tax=Actinoplanes hulinensis TaxID=1144547 RepID=A0ABS7BD87_9ACTN|nr:glycoside hydrolase family 3 N-terminal domain-containing protein [Actinoplanes hulinensis]MBW6438975.1 glycoside hydrolase family 3 protein [Actinoplanes hulinensis]